LKGKKKLLGKGKRKEKEAECMLRILEGRQLRRKEQTALIARFNWDEIKMDRHRENWIYCQTVSLTGIFFLQLWTLVPAEKRDAYLSGEKTDTAPVIDLLPLGYSKVLGKGRLPQIPLVVRARYFSRDAEQKIKEAGGVVELVA
jgi:ribosomal protein L15